MIGGVLAFIGGLFLLLVLRHHGDGAPYPNGTQPVAWDQPGPAAENPDTPPRMVPAKGGKTAISVVDSEHCVLMARTEIGSGTAFIASDSGRAYVYTNVHVASANNLAFTDFRGAPIPVDKQGEVVGLTDSETDEPGIDIVRFPLIHSPELALQFATRSRIEQKPEVWTLGDSGGQSILLTLKGRIKGVGPSKIEVDCEFVQGNSGGPIITAEGEVVGIASYMTIDPSIWAKGTQQEIRRIGWIPGKNFHWQSTSAAALAAERGNVINCLVTSDLMIVIGLLEAGKTGFNFPKDMPEEAGKVMAMAENHPLRKGIEETSRTIQALSKKGGLSWIAAHREYVRFFNSCVAYQTSQIDKTANTVKSSFWRNQLESKMQAHREILTNFQSKAKRFETTGRENSTLSND
jgi:hypothetical protein